MELITISTEEPIIRSDGTPEPLNPDQKPAIGALGSAEFLLANHTGNTSLGLFFKADTGEPVRGTIAWASNVRSIGKSNRLPKGVYLINEHSRRS